MKKSKMMKALLVFGMSAITATSIAGFTACGDSHTHNWSWKDDGNGTTHSRECTAEGHEGDKKETENHKDANKDGKCDACKYVMSTNPGPGGPGGPGTENPPTPAEETAKNYATLKEQGSAIVDYTFDEAVTLGTTTSSHTFGVKGWYSSVDGGASVASGALTQATNKTANFSTFLDLGPIVADTVVEGSFKITLNSKLGTGWKIFRLRDNSNAVLEVVAAKEDEVFTYAIKDATVPAAETSTASKLSKAYEVYFKIDLKTGKLSLYIDGNKIFSQIDTPIRNLSGIEFPTSDSAKRQSSVDDVIVCGQAMTVAQYKESLNAKLQKTYDDLDKTAYTVNATALSDALTAAKTSVNNSSDSDYALVLQAYNTALASIKAVKSDLEVAKDNAIAELNATDLTVYSEANKTKVEAEIASGIATIKLATTTEGVTTALNNAKTAIGNIAKTTDATVDITIHYGSSTATLPVKQGGKVDEDDVKALITAPSGEIYGGCYTDSEYGTAYDFTATVEAAGDIYVKFIADAREDHTYTLAYKDITGISSDKAAVAQSNLPANSFVTVVSGVTWRNSNSAIEVKDGGLKVTFQGTGTLTVKFASTGGSNNSRIGLQGAEGYVDGTSTATKITTGDDAGTFETTGTSYVDVTFTVSKSGTYTIVCPSGVTNRGARITSIKMVDTY